MSEGPGRPPREFLPIDDVHERLRLLREGAKTAAPAFIWTHERQEVIETNITSFARPDQPVCARIPAGFDPVNFSVRLSKLKDRDCYFSVSLARANLFFRTEYLGHDATSGLKFRAPDKVFKVQRRKDLRYPIPVGYVLKVQFQDPLATEERTTHKVIDLSAGGLAFHVSEKEAPIYQPDVPLRKVSFTLRRRIIDCDAVVRHVRPLPQDTRFKGGARVGIIFRGMKPADTHHVASYVFEESRKYFVQFI